MTDIIKGFFASISGRNAHESNDFSAFFSKPAGDKVKVIRQVLREANAEQRKVMKEYKDKEISKI